MSRSTHYAEWHEYNIWVNVKISLEKKGSRSTMCPITLNTKQRLTCLCDINIQVLVNSSHDCQEKRIATFSTEDLLQVFWMFCAVAEKKKKMEPFQKEINNKSSMHLSGAAEETQFNSSIMFRPLFYSNLWGNIERRNQWMIYNNIFLMNWSGQKVHV